jgi:hypothetical protein
MDDATVARFGAAVRQAAASVSTAIGGRPPDAKRV